MCHVRLEQGSERRGQGMQCSLPCVFGGSINDGNRLGDGEKGKEGKKACPIRPLGCVQEGLCVDWLGGK